MTTQIGTLAAALAAASGTTLTQVQGIRNAKPFLFAADTFEGDMAQNDTLVLGAIPSNAIIDPNQSILWFDDLGTSITMDIGDSNDTNNLCSAIDVATAAGNTKILASVDIANYYKPLWKLLGYTTDPGGKLTIYATFAGGNPAAGSIAWQIVGYLPGV